MAGYKPLKITGMTTGLVQSREEFILPSDAYPTLQNAYIWRERIKRKQGAEFLGRLQRNFTTQSLGNTPASSTWTFNIYSTLVPAITSEPNAQVMAGSVTITDGVDTFKDQGNGTLKRQDGDLTSTINYATGSVTLNRTTNAINAATITFSYYPDLPVMGLKTRENQNSRVDQMVAFDTKYAYVWNGSSGQFQEFLPGTTWTGSDSEFFWTTNYFTGTGQLKIFWATNFSVTGDPIRYTNGQPATNWIDFTPQINTNGDTLNQALAIVPFRGRLVAFNTKIKDGMSGAISPFTNQIRWAAIGNPFTVPSAIVTDVNPNAWRDDIRGQGGFLNIPTSEDIISVGFVRDNLVVYCEHSTWQLRYTGRSIAPFQIEKVNSELGAQGTFSTVQFDTSLVGIGDKGIVECDSFKSNLIDIKIPDLVYSFQNANNGPERVYGIRDFQLRLAYWVFCSASANGIYPDQRLVYNYENDSWALFNDSFTCFGTFQPPVSSSNWVSINKPWVECNFPWISQTLDVPLIVSGNQQGFVFVIDQQTINDPSLFIQNITGNTTTPTVITSPNHNLQTGTIIQISGIPNGTPFANLNAGINPSTGLPYNANNGIFFAQVLSANLFQLLVFNPLTQQFSSPQLDPPQTFVGTGNVAIRDNFSIFSKKFNFFDNGQSIQMGFIDLLMDSTETVNSGAMSLNVYLDYDQDTTSNTLPDNANNDMFFNTIVPTTKSPTSGIAGSKFMQRVFCPTRANFLTLEYTFSNAQMAGIESELDIQIDGQVLWIRPSGRLTQNY